MRWAVTASLGPFSFCVVQEPRVRDQLPLAIHSRVDLAGAALPGKVPSCRVAPERVHVHDLEGAVVLPREDDLHDLPPVVDELMGLEKLEPPSSPPLGVVASELYDPEGGVVRVRSRRPWPDHVGMEDRQEQCYVLAVPGPRLPVD